MKKLLVIGTVAAATFSALTGAASQTSRNVWVVERDGSPYRLCTPRRIFPKGSSFVTVCASDDRGRHWRPIFSMAAYTARQMRSPVDADWTLTRLRVRHWAPNEGSIAIDGSARVGGHDHTWCVRGCYTGLPVNLVWTATAADTGSSPPTRCAAAPTRA